jgi:hypothetical protein
MKSQELIALLEATFTERSLGDGMSQRRAHEIDDLRIPFAPGFTRTEDDITDDWRRVSAVDPSCFYDYDDKGWRYYLPAALRNYLLAGEDSLDHDLKFLLLPEESEWSPNDFVERVGLNDTQAKCIARILQHFSSDLDEKEQQQLAKWIEAYGKDV